MKKKCVKSKPRTRRTTAAPRGVVVHRFVLFRCPKCKRVAKVERADTEPPNCAVVDLSCPDCNPDGPELIDYFDYQGRQIDCDGKKLND